MLDKAPDGWRKLTARELDAQFAGALIRIGERLAKDANIVSAPLPERLCWTNCGGVGALVVVNGR